MHEASQELPKTLGEPGRPRSHPLTPVGTAHLDRSHRKYLSLLAPQARSPSREDGLMGDTGARPDTAEAGLTSTPWVDKEAQGSGSGPRSQSWGGESDPWSGGNHSPTPTASPAPLGVHGGATASHPDGMGKSRWG